MAIGLRGIRIERATGRSEFCGEVREVDGWAEADEALDTMSALVDRGRVDACDFVATFDDGFAYAGTIELRHPLDRDGAPDLAAHVRGANSGLLSDDPATERYRRFVDPTGERAAAVRAMFEDYAFDDAVATPRLA